MKISLRHVLSNLLIITLINACQSAVAESANSARVTRAFTGTMLEPQGFIQRTHDPVIARAGDTYYVFSTGSRIPFICSKDKINWEFCGRVFEKDPAWIREINPNLVDIWAPDISYFNDEWHLYYAASSFGSQNSAIGLATNATLDPNSPDYNWVDRGIVLRSREGDPWNAIDANLVHVKRPGLFHPVGYILDGLGDVIVRYIQLQPG
jgi:arabinan endo-1,5-alpha-L-arabinosidase